jgi:hypothetical protein
MAEYITNCLTIARRGTFNQLGKKLNDGEIYLNDN